MTYQSLNQPVPTGKELGPHAIAFNGACRHIRAYRFEHRDYCDFISISIFALGLTHYREVVRPWLRARLT